MKVAFGSEFKKKTLSDFTKFSLKSGEMARINVFGTPQLKYVHNLSKVVIGDDGKAIMEQRDNGKRSWEQPATEFVGKFLCLGDEDTLFSKESDPDNCPACAAAQETQAIEKAKARYGVNVLQYVTKSNSFALKEPYQVTCKPWEFSENRFGQLVDIANEQDGLGNVDLLIKCTNGQFQLLDISAGKTGDPEYKRNDERKKMTAEVIKADAMEDFSILMGKTVSAGELNGFIKQVTDQWELAFNSGAASSAESNTADSEDFSSIVNSGSSVSSETVEDSDDSENDDAVDDVEDLDSLLAQFK